MEGLFRRPRAPVASPVQNIVAVLRFQVSGPTTFGLASAMAHALDIEPLSSIMLTAMYFVDVSLLEVRFLRYRHSVLACAALYLSSVYFHSDHAVCNEKRIVC